ncbi:MAG: potassium uptake protein, TrkH family [Oscillospiraceae bacterium]|nr:potassium uptake protein, TrkH family [Oscillospiraceae bacterium]
MILKFRDILRRLQRALERFSAMQIITMVFLCIILVGALLLMLPCASRSGEGTDLLTALFTATSCTCVTGLSLVDTFTHWSGFGQTVILVLIQIGGLGFMTILTLFFFMLGTRIGIKERLVLAQSFGLDKLSGIVKMVKKVLRRTLILEAVGAVVLTIRFAFQMPFGRALWCGVFHAVSAFCNAGFDILGAVEQGGSLTPYVSDPVVDLTLMALIVIGGLGFFVWEDILTNRRFSKCSVYTRLVLVLDSVLILGGAVLFALLEWNGPAFGSLPAAEKILASLFQSVTTRTAGFYTVPQGALSDASIAVTDLLMFIGGGSGSTAGGAKMVTIGVLLLSVIATARGSSRVTVFHRTIRADRIRDAVSVVMMMFALSLLSAIVLSALNGISMQACLYETISALATVGLSTGITAQLNVISRAILIVLMFFGRVGIMTVSLGFMLSDGVKERYRYADTKVLIG